MRLNYNLFFGFFQAFGGFGVRFLGDGFWNGLEGGFSRGRFFSGNMVFDELSTVVNAVNEASNANDEHVNTEEAGKHGDVEFACINNNESHNTAGTTCKDADKAVGWVDGGKEAVEEVDEARNEYIDSKDDQLEGEVAIGEEEDNKCGKNIYGGVNDAVDPAVFFGGIVESVGGVYDTHKD